MGSPFLIIERVGAKEDAAAMAKYLITTLVLAASALADDSSAYAAPQGGYAAPAAAYAPAAPTGYGAPDSGYAAPLPRCLRCHHRCPALCSTPRCPLQRQGRTSGRRSGPPWRDQGWSHQHRPQPLRTAALHHRHSPRCLHWQEFCLRVLPE